VFEGRSRHSDRLVGLAEQRGKTTARRVRFASEGAGWDRATAASSLSVKARVSTTWAARNPKLAVRIMPLAKCSKNALRK
jgi:hypothetical protein